MLEIIRAKNGEILVAIEWWLVNSNGTLNNKGECVYIAEAEASSHLNGQVNQVISKIIFRIYKRAPWVKIGYFQRSKYDKRVRCYTKNQWLRFARRHDDKLDN